MIHALGESRRRPVFAPSECRKGIRPSAIVYYPAVRGNAGFLGSSTDGTKATDFLLQPESDWVPVQAKGDDSGGRAESASGRWVLSLGGRVANFMAIRESIEQLSAMLKCGFEFEHYLPAVRSERLAATLKGLNAEEQWILSRVCLGD